MKRCKPFDAAVKTDLVSIYKKPWETGMYREIGHQELLQKGDEYLTTSDKFLPICLTAIGTYPDETLVVRRRKEIVL